MKPIRILYVCGGIMNRGGIESYMMNYYRNLDRSKIQIDFVIHGFGKGVYDDEIIELGGRIYQVPIKSRDYFGNIKALKKIFLLKEHKIIHSHMDAMGMVVLRLAKKCEVPIRIAHSHNTQHLTNNKLKFVLNEYARKNINKYATHKFACSEAAGKWLFGENDEFEVIKNAVDSNKFIFNKNLRDIYKKQFQLEDKFIVGHIGRFDYQKNHNFIIEEFAKVSALNSKAHLVLIGDGHLKNSIVEKIKIYNLIEKVTLIPACGNVNEVINIFDVFILPSLFEGLGIVAIEAQINGLNCILSNAITREVCITDKVKFLDIKTDWSNTIQIAQDLNKDRSIDLEIIKVAGYDIKTEVKKIEKKYLQYVEEFYEN